MKKVLAATAVTALAATAAIPAFAGTKSIKVGDNYFVHDGGRPKVTVKRGAKVRFVFRGQAPHNIIVKHGPAHFRSGVRVHGVISKRFTRRGTYLLYCSIHGVRDMSMTLKVG